MLSRVVFFCIAAFWVTMNVLLWRSEYAGQNAPGSLVPVEIVWQKILTAPDNSSLEVLHHGKKIGFCRWAANVGEELTTGQILNDNVPLEGMVKRLTGYKIDFEGNIALKDFPSRLRFSVTTKFTTNHIWQELLLNVNIRPFVWEIHSIASEQAVHLRMEDENGKTGRVFKFSDLQNPQAWLQELQGSAPLALLTSALPLNSKISPLELGLKWEARNDWFQIAHTSVRAYQLQTTILDRYSVRIIVSRVGEILRVELPNDVVLVNDQLVSL